MSYIPEYQVNLASDTSCSLASFSSARLLRRKKHVTYGKSFDISFEDVNIRAIYVSLIEHILKESIHLSRR